MTQFIKTCYKCQSKVIKVVLVKEGVDLNCLRCLKCGEEYFTSSELIKFDILKGNRKNIRKFGTLGDSTIMRIPSEVVKSFKIKPGDFGVFEKRPDGILIRTVHKEDLV